MDTQLTADASGGDFILSQLLRGAGQIFAFMPLNQASMGAVAREEAADAAGLYNMARNLGGSLGLALLGVFIDRQTTGQAQAIRASLSANSDMGQTYIAGRATAIATQSGSDTAAGQMQALAQLARTVQQQAVVITYSDCFWILGVAIIAMVPLVFLLKMPSRNAAPLTAAH
jgi:DHA2 family multidrug resistance protein